MLESVPRGEWISSVACHMRDATRTHGYRYGCAGWPHRRVVPTPYPSRSASRHPPPVTSPHTHTYIHMDTHHEALTTRLIYHLTTRPSSTLTLTAGYL